MTIIDCFYTAFLFSNAPVPGDESIISVWRSRQTVVSGVDGTPLQVTRRLTPKIPGNKTFVRITASAQSYSQCNTWQEIYLSPVMSWSLSQLILSVTEVVAADKMAASFHLSSLSAHTVSSPAQHTCTSQHHAQIISNTFYTAHTVSSPAQHTCTSQHHAQIISNTFLKIRH